MKYSAMLWRCKFLSVMTALMWARVGGSTFATGGGGLSRPFFAEPIANVTVAVGRDASLACVVENLGSHRVAWVHLDRQMIVTIHRQVVTRIPRFSVSHDHPITWLLHIRGAQPEDAGRYMCQVNSDPMVSQQGAVTVVVPPSVLDGESSPSQLSARENVRVMLVCRGHGVPEPRVTWKREDGQPLVQNKASVYLNSSYSKHVSSQEGEELTFPKVSRTDSGAYLCIASNGVPPSVSKRITLDVEFEPMMIVPNQLLGTQLGTNLTLECITEAQPRPITYWLRTDSTNVNGIMLIASNRFKPETNHSGYQTHMMLHIYYLNPQDIGNYKCVSKNSLGEAEGSIRIYKMAATQAPTNNIETAEVEAPFPSRETAVEGKVKKPNHLLYNSKMDDETSKGHSTHHLQDNTYIDFVDEKKQQRVPNPADQTDQLPSNKSGKSTLRQSAHFCVTTVLLLYILMR